MSELKELKLAYAECSRQRNELLNKLKSQVQPAQQEPVAAECNFVGTKEWGRCSIEHHNLVQSEPHNWPGYQTRLLYTPPPASKPLTGIRVWGWVWKDKIHEDGCCYVPSYTPEQPLKSGELLALVDPADLHQPLENTKWHHPTDAALGIKENT